MVSPTLNPLSFNDRSITTSLSLLNFCLPQSLESRMSLMLRQRVMHSLHSPFDAITPICFNGASSLNLPSTSDDLKTDC